MKARIVRLAALQDRPGRGEVEIVLLGKDGTSATFTVETPVAAVESMARSGFIGADVDIGYLLSHSGATVVLS